MHKNDVLQLVNDPHFPLPNTKQSLNAINIIRHTITTFINCHTPPFIFKQVLLHIHRK